jgi:large subunit ribosomal protein L21
MYAVIESGGKQYRVEEGATLKVESLEAAPGASVTLDRVLLVADGSQVTVGAPHVAGASVQATVLGHGRGRKVIVFKYKPKAHYRRKQGHRQDFTHLRIDKISLA